MTKERLKKYRTLKAELDDLEMEINSKILHDSVQRSKREFPYTFGHDHIEGVADKDYSLLLRKSELKIQIREIEEFVNGIENYIVKKAIMIYYINEIEDGENKPTWEDVADKIGNGLSSEAIKKLVTRCLKNF